MILIATVFLTNKCYILTVHWREFSIRTFFFFLHLKLKFVLQGMLFRTAVEMVTVSIQEIGRLSVIKNNENN